MSQSGARLIVEKPPKVGDFGTMQCEGFELFFDVVWRTGFRVGIAFDELVSDRTLIHLRQFNDRFRNIQQQEAKSLARKWVLGERH